MTAWTDYVKEFAKKHNTTYGCALSMPECSAGYKAMKGEKPKKAPKIKAMKASDMMPKPVKRSAPSAEQTKVLRELKESMLPKKKGRGKRDVIGDIGRVADIGMKLAPLAMML
jgi:hypothetical protein